MNKSKYYYDYTRNMNDDKKTVTCNCSRNLKACTCLYSEAVQSKLDDWIQTRSDMMSESEKKDEEFFDNWTKSLEDMEQPKCDIDNPDDCENCGS